MVRWRPRHILASLVAATSVFVGVLGWLGLRLLEQDTQIGRQRRVEAHASEARRLAQDVVNWLATLRTQTDPESALRLTLRGIETSAAQPVLYQPAAPLPVSQADDAFAHADTELHQRRNLAGALSILRRLSASPDRSIRGAALLRLGVVHRQLGEPAAALSAYDRLAALDGSTIGTQPAALLAGYAKGRTLETLGPSSALAAETKAFANLLLSRSWPIDRAASEEYWAAAIRWGADPPPAMAAARTETAVILWNQWRSGTMPSTGEDLLRGLAEPTLALWHVQDESVAVRIVTRLELQTALNRLASSRGLEAAVFFSNGAAAFGPPRADGFSLAPADTQLPFTFRTWPIDDVADGLIEARRRLLLISALLGLFTVMLAAAYGLFRAMSRELRVARLQTEFVAAVSHEFRTPLTSMRHLLDLLATRGIAPDRRPHYYELLATETERLLRLVESLLTFGRIEMGKPRWKAERFDLTALVCDLTVAFRRDPLAVDREVSLELPGTPTLVIGDQEAIGRALWNLLDNAAKYSPAGSPIAISLRRSSTRTKLSVRDHGMGIEGRDVRRVFQKFVRTENAQRAGIRGVGVGLALVKMIATGHGGSVDVESVPGTGSTFTISLPTGIPDDDPGSVPRRESARESRDTGAT
jgi:signal transduction histidine kinase